MVWNISFTTLGDSLNVTIFIMYMHNCIMGARLMNGICLLSLKQ